MSNYPIGIYLGINDSSIAIWGNLERAEIIQNNNGDYTTPSVVSFTKNKRLVGVAAKRIKIRNPKNTIYGIREIIGKKYDDPDVQKFIKKVPFEIEKDSKTNKPKIIIEYLNKIISFYPEEIYAMIIEELKQSAEIYLNRKIKEAIITVPSYYNYIQRQVIKYSAKICRLNVLKIVNEEIAVCYAYGLHNEKKEMNILVFNMRSNETNVSIVNLNNFIFEINRTIRDDNLGGNLFDEELTKYCINKFKEQTGIIIQKDSKPYKRLKKECEKCKINLSYVKGATIDIDALEEGEDFNIDIIKRNIFEDMCGDLFNKSISLIERVLEDSNLTKDQIDEIILTGGSTRIPKIQQIIKEFFNGKELNCYINSQEVYAYGAAVEATIKEKGNNNKNTIEIKNNEISDEEIERSIDENNEYNEIKKNSAVLEKKKKLKEDMKKNDIPKEILNKKKKK